MLIQFSLSNYKSFKEEVKLSLLASNYDKTFREEENIIHVPKFGLRLLKSAVVYGANASGKTKLVEGMNFMKHFLLNSSKEGQIDEPINVVPFKLSTATEHASSTFEIIFLHEEELFRYGFEVNAEQVLAEWLYHRPKTKEVELFYREKQNFQIHRSKFKVTDLIAHDRVRPNALLLSVAANWNDKIAKRIFDWFKNFNIISGLKEEGFEAYSVNRIQKDTYKKAAIEFLKAADLGIEDLLLQKLDVDNLPSNIPTALKEFILKRKKEENDADFFSDLLTIHKKYAENNLFKEMVSFSMTNEESSGTRKYFALSGPVLETLKNGEVLVVDELANKLHPNLACKLVEIFNSKDKNPHNAQLIFNTHDTNLLSSGLFRRDQIWFTEKDRYGASTLYSLNDFKSDEVRKGEDYEKNYIQGKYGAIPYLGDFEQLLESLKLTNEALVD